MQFTVKSQRGVAEHLVLLVVVLILLVIAGFFLLRQKVPPAVAPSLPVRTTAPTKTPAEEKLEPLPSLSSSDEIEAIEKDLNATEIGNLENDLGSIEEDAGGL